MKKIILLFTIILEFNLFSDNLKNNEMANISSYDEFFQKVEQLEEEPNEVTLEAMRGADRIARDDSVKGYDSIEELREALGV